MGVKQAAAWDKHHIWTGDLEQEINALWFFCLHLSVMLWQVFKGLEVGDGWNLDTQLPAQEMLLKKCLELYRRCIKKLLKIMNQ